MSHAVSIDSLHVRFGAVTAVAGVSFDVDFGEIVTVLGPNGAGKTTTVETLLGFRRPDAGTVRLMGLDPVSAHGEVVTRVGALLQRGGVWSPMNPRDVLRLTSSYYAAPRDVNELLDALDLQRCATTPWRRLSGGEQQRTLLALALLGRPRVLVLDEPTSAVDPEGHASIRALLDAERQRGCALVITTHELADAELLADRIVIINDGAVAAAGTLAELAGDPVLVFESTVALDTVALGALLGGPVVDEGQGRYRCAVGNTPANVSAVTTAINERGGQLTSLRSRASLEETYLALVEQHRSRS